VKFQKAKVSKGKGGEKPERHRAEHQLLYLLFIPWRLLRRQLPSLRYHSVKALRSGASFIKADSGDSGGGGGGDGSGWLQGKLTL